MVTKQKKNSRKKHNSKRFNVDSGRARKINASTAVGTCSEPLSPFGGLLGLVKFLDLVDFKKHFEEAYIAPSRETKLGDYGMVLGILGLMFIGFNRIWHFVYIGLEPMLCGIFNLKQREYIYGKLRQGETMSGEDTANVICALEGHLPLFISANRMAASLPVCGHADSQETG